MAKTKTLTEGTPWKLLLSFSIPILIGQVVQLFYSLVDTKVVGATLGELALASVGSVYTLYNLTNGFANGLTMGFAIIIAMYFGRKDEKNLKKGLCRGYSAQPGYYCGCDRGADALFASCFRAAACTGRTDGNVRELYQRPDCGTVCHGSL